MSATNKNKNKIDEIITITDDESNYENNNSSNNKKHKSVEINVYAKNNSKKLISKKRYRQKSLEINVCDN